MAKTADELLAPPDVADHLGVPERTLSQWRYLGKGPEYMKIGRHIRYRKSALERWLDQQIRTRNA